jgi:hypothetical protein
MRLTHSFEGRIGGDYSSIEIISNADQRFLSAFICVYLRSSAAKFLPMYQSLMA